MGLLGKIGSGVGSVVRGTATGVYRMGVWTANRRRWIFRSRLPDYAVIELSQPLSERAPAEPWWYSYIPGRETGPSLESLGDALEQVARDPDVSGAVLIVRGPVVTLPQAQSAALLFGRFREGDDGEGKQLIVYLEQASMATYVMACAADKVAVAPLTSWDVFGLRAAPTFLKDTLAKFGVEFDVVKIAPWKTAADTLSRSAMSEEHRQQLTWLLDSLYEEAVSAISSGRGLAEDVVSALINDAPLTAESALEAGLIDWVAYEDELPALLGKEDEPAQLKYFADIEPLLMRHARPHHGQAIGVLSLRGSIMPGKSRRSPVPLPFFGQQTIGSTTVQQQIRAARKDDSLAAIILHVDSPGGSALASDLIWRELVRLDQVKPVIVYMGDVAASGGYYIAAPGRKIVAQRSTITGSIGVIIAKPVTAGVYDKLDAHKETVQRGDNAGLFALDASWSESQYTKIEDTINDVYGSFKQRVADGREIELDSLDAIAQGRVWTGNQALTHNLIDEVGDITAAARLACEAADLPTDGTVPMRPVSGPKQSLLATPVDAVQELLGLRTSAELSGLALSLASGELIQTLQHERVWLLADGLPDLR